MEYNSGSNRASNFKIRRSRSESYFLREKVNSAFHKSVGNIKRKATKKRVTDLRIGKVSNYRYPITNC